MRSHGLGALLFWIGCASDEAAVVRDAGAELLLSAAGLYADIERGELAEGVESYIPLGELWSDGASKNRFVQLPSDSQIDTTDMDAWRYPVGTRLWKELSIDGVRIETRLLEKTSTGHWNMVAFLWDEAGTDAVAVPNGVENALGTEHDVPSAEYCQRCHAGVPDSVIGFSAVQLAHAGSEVTLDELTRETRLSRPPSTPLDLPGDETAQRALLYLHANCGNCHNAHTFIASVTNVDYWVQVEALASVERTSTYATLQRDLRRNGSVDDSDTVRRMLVRNVQGQMPPIASDLVDEQGSKAVIEWMRMLEPPAAADEP